MSDAEFPAFSANGLKVLVFSRGRGRGHAITDIEIFRRVESQRNDVQTRFVSYATGSQTLDEFETRHIDLGMPESNPITDTTVLTGRLIAWLKPDVVVSHEEFPALPVAKIFNRPTLAITDWFSDTEAYSSHSLKYADRVLFSGEPDSFDEPAWVRGKVCYVGYLVREPDRSLAAREKARRRFEADDETCLIGVFPGAPSEMEVPAAELIREALQRLPAENKRLVWICGEDYQLLANRLQRVPQAQVLQGERAVEDLTLAADLAITKGSRHTTLLELGLLGTPAIVLTSGLNPPNDRKALSLPHVTLRPLSGMDPVSLSEHLAESLRGPREPVDLRLGLDEAAREVNRFLNEMAAD